MDKNLEMIFQNAAGKNARISVADPKDNLTAAEVQTAMDTILAKNIFNTTGGDIVKVVSARIVTRDVAEILPQS
ncbi:DUF2922 family protein [Biomaibacter acetigenes]|jgi:hypothetical protein|uniref:DUF2922 family protein n=1 Tax=Biomaibacter acetigenes TaxID=2316383 RepID=A0A3G2R8V9_9FIRM|nr:DUF2922 domain-containing protein [Biomaibacter acetigenes]AYO31458.1 DUF2922 family protein [Biomaibacter acetigenes]MDN5302764.1 hypothetical protein [Thermoanaerobacteraceae bacterium]RKL62655.1 DUF2922 domain-containing protein [Thermoanaerobacteraceae bacterium SP2]